MDVREAIERRRAYRSLSPVKITPELLADLAHAASLAPSCFNKQPWRFVAVYDREILSRLHGALARGNEWAPGCFHAHCRVPARIWIASWASGSTSSSIPAWRWHFAAAGDGTGPGRPSLRRVQTQGGGGNPQHSRGYDGHRPGGGGEAQSGTQPRPVRSTRSGMKRVCPERLAPEKFFFTTVTPTAFEDKGL